MRTLAVGLVLTCLSVVPASAALIPTGRMLVDGYVGANSTYDDLPRVRMSFSGVEGDPIPALGDTFLAGYFSFVSWNDDPGPAGLPVTADAKAILYDDDEKTTVFETFGTSTIYVFVDQTSVPGQDRVYFAQTPSCAVTCATGVPSFLVTEFYEVRVPLFFRRGSLTFTGIGAPQLFNGQPASSAFATLERAEFSDPIPEPSTLGLIALGLPVLALWRRR